MLKLIIGITTGNKELIKIVCIQSQFSVTFEWGIDCYVIVHSTCVYGWRHRFACWRHRIMSVRQLGDALIRWLFKKKITVLPIVFSSFFLSVFFSFIGRRWRFTWQCMKLVFVVLQITTQQVVHNYRNDWFEIWKYKSENIKNAVFHAQK